MFTGSISAPLIFVNARTFKEQVLSMTKVDPRPRWVLVAAEPITDIDTTACGMLSDLVEVLDHDEVRPVFAELKDPVRAKLSQFGLDATFDESRFYPTLSSAVAEYRELTQSEWTMTSGGTHEQETDGR